MPRHVPQIYKQNISIGSISLPVLLAYSPLYRVCQAKSNPTSAYSRALDIELIENFTQN
jgi:hypothetical protein